MSDEAKTVKHNTFKEENRKKLYRKVTSANDVVIMTYDTANTHYQDLPFDLIHSCNFDEGHHAASTGGNRLVRYILNRTDSEIRFFTATPNCDDIKATSSKGRIVNMYELLGYARKWP